MVVFDSTCYINNLDHLKLFQIWLKTLIFDFKVALFFIKQLISRIWINKFKHFRIKIIWFIIIIKVFKREKLYLFINLIILVNFFNVFLFWLWWFMQLKYFSFKNNIFKISCWILFWIKHLVMQVLKFLININILWFNCSLQTCF